MQGAFIPTYTGHTYLAFCRAVIGGAGHPYPRVLSVGNPAGRATLGLSLARFLSALKAAGLGNVWPGTAAEILDDRGSRHYCPEQDQYRDLFEVMRTRTTWYPHTATIMFGHCRSLPALGAPSASALRDLQADTGVSPNSSVPFVHMEAPIFLKGRIALRVRTFRERS